MSNEEIKTKEVERLESFIKEQRPDHTYLIDGKRDAQESTICRSDLGWTNCLKLRMPSTQLFAEMQRLNYFCILPQGRSASENVRSNANEDQRQARQKWNATRLIIRYEGFLSEHNMTQRKLRQAFVITVPSSASQRTVEDFHAAFAFYGMALQALPKDDSRDW